MEIGNFYMTKLSKNLRNFFKISNTLGFLLVDKAETTQTQKVDTYVNFSLPNIYIPFENEVSELKHIFSS